MPFRVPLDPKLCRFSEWFWSKGVAFGVPLDHWPVPISVMTRSGSMSFRMP